MKFDRRKWHYRWLDCLSQFLNVTFLNGDPDESISGRCWRQERTWAVWIINKLFFWQIEHCKSAYLTDVNRAIDRVQQYEGAI